MLPCVFCLFLLHNKERLLSLHFAGYSTVTSTPLSCMRLKQIVYKTGHMMTSYTMMWCMHRCYDKALVTIEKALDCNPHNPGFTLIKAIILRMSGRFEEANSWLESVSKNFYKLLEPSRDTQESITGQLSIAETRNELIKQWYMIR